ncbi:hypothetical protein [Candidatus Thiodiazotropha sp. CDECU1]|nr:hypothetical protein [Candidatus Thiodiazotropha sp. CDECU1]
MKKIVRALQIPLPIVLFLAADSEELEGLDSETTKRLSAAALEVMKA